MSKVKLHHVVITLIVIIAAVMLYRKMQAGG